MKKLAVLLPSLFLCACATSEQIQGPNGKMAYSITCGGADIASCYKEAAKLCPGGYNLIDRMQSSAGAINKVGNTFIATPGPSTMLVECKG